MGKTEKQVRYLTLCDMMIISFLHSIMLPRYPATFMADYIQVRDLATFCVGVPQDHLTVLVLAVTQK